VTRDWDAATYDRVSAPQVEWIADHDALFARLHAAIAPGRRLVAQCGGEGNVERFLEAARAVASEQPYAPVLTGWRGPWNFAGAEETAKRLTRAGFDEVETWLEPYPVAPPDPSGYLRSICLGNHLEQLPEELRGRYVEAVRERCGRELDYVRMNILAKRP
jgi:trans-aconitate 2-methyltransferase